jgi:hypothetical protein
MPRERCQTSQRLLRSRDFRQQSKYFSFYLTLTLDPPLARRMPHPRQPPSHRAWQQGTRVLPMRQIARPEHQTVSSLTNVCQSVLAPLAWHLQKGRINIINCMSYCMRFWTE